MSTSLFRSARNLSKTPGFSLVVLATLTVGVGLTTALFAILEGIVLRPLPFHDPEQLVTLRVVFPEMAKQYPDFPVNARFFEDWRRECRAFSEVALVDRTSAVLTGAGEPANVEGVRVSTNLLQTLGEKPLIGRGFLSGEEQEGRVPVALIGESVWRRQFGGSADVIGRSVVIDHHPFTVIGVLRDGLRIPAPVTRGIARVRQVPIDFMVLKRFPADELAEAVGRFNYEVIARLAPGATLESAEAQLNVVGARIVKDSGEKTEVRGLVFPLQASFVGDTRSGLWWLLGAAAAVLLIASLNLAVLNLVRAEGRALEFQVRAALGAGRWTLFWEAASESVILTALGGVGGLAAAYASLGWLLRLAPSDLPRVSEVTISGPAVIFAGGLILISGVIAAGLSAWRLSRSVAAGSQAISQRTSSDSARSLRWQSLFVGAEVGIGMVLLSIGLLFAGSYLKLLNVNQGFNGTRLMTGTIRLPAGKFAKDADLEAFNRRLLTAATSVPGVERVALASALPLQGETWVDGIAAASGVVPSLERQPTNVRFISEDFFGVMGIPLREGRTFNERDRGRTVAVISQRLALRLWPGQSAVGRNLIRGENEPVEVIGVAGDVRANADQEPVCMMYRPFWDWPMTRVELVFRTSDAAPFSAEALRAALRSADSDVPAPTLVGMDELFSRSTAGRRFLMLLSDAFASAALAIAVFGIYGVLAYWVARRRKEIGIRVALGAGPGVLRRQVLLRGMRPVVAGVAIGGVAAWLASEGVAGMLYGSLPPQGQFLLEVAGLFLAIGVLACWIPVVVATRLDPMEALRDP